MTRHQNDQYKMLELVEFHFNNNASVWSANVLMADVKNALSAKLVEINVAFGLQIKKTTGATKGKSSLRADLEEKGFRLTTALKTYASLNPDGKHLDKRLFIAKSAFVLFREAELLVTVENLNGAAAEIIGALQPYGITQATLDELMAARTAFLEMAVVPGEIFSARKEATQAIATLLREAIGLLKSQMDGLVELLRPAEPEFAQNYFNDRRTRQTAHRKLSLSITTMDAGANVPLAKANIEVVGHGIKRVSNKNGHNKVRNLKEGYYSLSVSRAGFVPQTIPITVISGQTTQLIIQMQTVLEEVSQ